MPVRVVIAEDHHLVREGIAKILSLYPELEVVGLAANGVETLEMVARTRPDLVLMDLSMPVMDGLEATCRLKEAFPQIKILVLTVCEEEGSLRQLMAQGADGYILKDIAPEMLLAAIKAVISGEVVIHPRLAGKLFSTCREESGERSQKLPRLTTREREVLYLLTRGKQNRDIARELFISEKTVKNHITSIFRKLQVEDRTQAVIFALKNKLVDL